MAADVFETGFGGDCFINGRTFPIVSWSLTIPATALNYTNSKVGNHEVTLTTFTNASGTAELDWALQDQPFQNSQGNLVPGTAVGPVVFQVSTASGDNWTISNMIILNTPMGLARAGKVTLSLQLKGSGGTYTAPGGFSF